MALERTSIPGRYGILLDQIIINRIERVKISKKFLCKWA